MYSPYGPKKTMPRNIVQPPDTVVGFQQDDHPALSRNLLRDLQTERAKAAEELILAKDWADYEKRRGLVHGIDQAIFLCTEVTKKLNA